MRLLTGLVLGGILATGALGAAVSQTPPPARSRPDHGGARQPHDP
jgi:hypothetical protein